MLSWFNVLNYENNVPLIDLTSIYLGIRRVGRLLAFLKQENVFYKSRLAEIVNTVDDEEIITEAEKFNEDFLSQDRIIDFLTDELKSQNKLLQKDLYLDGELLQELISHQKKLRSDFGK